MSDAPWRNDSSPGIATQDDAPGRGVSPKIAPACVVDALECGSLLRLSCCELARALRVQVPRSSARPASCPAEREKAAASCRTPKALGSRLLTLDSRLCLTQAFTVTKL